MKIACVSKPSPSRQMSEDFHVIQYDGITLKAAVGDWASNLVGGKYRYAPVASLLGLQEDTELGGGVIGATLARDVIAQSNDTGYELIDKINTRIRQAYEDLGVTEYKEDRSYTFTGYIAHIVVKNSMAMVTAVGDVRIAIDGKVIGGRTKEIDNYHAEMRAKYVRLTNHEPGSFDHIKPSVVNQYIYQNNPVQPFCYPAIDGTRTMPFYSIEVRSVSNPKHILMWSDGFLIPDEFSLQGLERKLEEVYRVDPHRCAEYPAVKSALDDRTAVEITF